MAHADYHCCAICNTKMVYSSDPTTKVMLCSFCAVRFFKLTREEVHGATEILDWIGRHRHSAGFAAQVLLATGWSPCYYSNPVDDAVRGVISEAERQSSGQRLHVDSEACWCGPRVEDYTPEGGSKLIVHQEPS